MQPLLSVDHETRHNSYRAENDNIQSPSEETPLLHTFPQSNAPERSRFTTLIVFLLLTLLLSGVIIGIYLLILTSEAEHVLPPVEKPLQLVSRVQWDRDKLSKSSFSRTPFKAKKVIVVQTNTKQCHNTKSCSKLLQEMQANFTSINSILPYNFLVSSNGQTYEVLGWYKPSPLFSQYSALVLGFIGEFCKYKPPRIQINEAKYFLDVSVSRNYIESNYSIIGKYTKEISNKLFVSLSSLPNWNSELSDSFQ